MALLAELIGVEHQVFLVVKSSGSCNVIVDEDLPRSTEVKTSSVLFLRFPLTSPIIGAITQGAKVTVGVKHPHMSQQVQLSEATLGNLKLDLTG